MSLAKLSHDLKTRVGEAEFVLIGAGNDLFRDVEAEIATEVSLHGETPELVTFRATLRDAASKLEHVSQIAALRAGELTALAGQ